MAGTSPKTEKRVFEGAGQINEIDLALGRVSRPPTKHELQRLVIDPTICKRLVAVLRGEELSSIQFNDLISREINYSTIFCEYTGAQYPGDEQIKAALETAQSAWGNLTEHDRFIPSGLYLSNLFDFFYAFNDAQKNEGKEGVKLYHTPNEEWWRTEKGVQHLPTEPGIIRCNFQEVMRSTDLVGSPFNLNKGQQETWAKEQVGDGLMSAEEVLYLFIRSILETGTPLWGAGYARCRNLHGSGYALDVSWNAGNGLFVEYWYRSSRVWFLGALARKFCGS